MRPLHYIVALAVLPCAAADLSSQLAAIEAQRASVERQMSSMRTQLATAEVQRQSVKRQEALLPVWKAPAVVAATSMVMPAAYDCEPIAKTEAESLIHSAANKESLPPELLRAVIKQESGFKPCAVSSVGAQGLMQLMPATAVDLHVANPFDPRENIQGGAAYLKQLVNRYGGDLRRALGAYNAGIGRVDAFGDVPNFAETQNYVASITDDVGYDQVPAITTVEATGHDFQAPALQLSIGSVKFMPLKDGPVTVRLSTDH